MNKEEFEEGYVDPLTLYVQTAVVTLLFVCFALAFLAYAGTSGWESWQTVICLAITTVLGLFSFFLLSFSFALSREEKKRQEERKDS